MSATIDFNNPNNQHSIKVSIKVVEEDVPQTIDIRDILKACETGTLSLNVSRDVEASYGLAEAIASNDLSEISSAVMKDASAVYAQRGFSASKLISNEDFTEELEDE